MICRGCLIFNRFLESSKLWIISRAFLLYYVIMKKETKLYRYSICLGFYFIFISAISFILLYPWSDIFQDGEEKYNVFEASSLVYNPSTGPYYVAFYVLLGVFVFFGMIMTLLSVFKKTSFLLSFLEFFGSIIIAWLGLFYFFYTNGRNVFTVVSFLLGSILAGIYFVFSLTRFIVKRMEKKVEKKIQEMK